MEKRRIGKSELEASVIGFGCWALSGPSSWSYSRDEETIEAVKTAYDLGVNFFDVAPVYGFGHAEEILGKALKGIRDKVIVASKCGLVWDEKGTISNLLTRESILREIDDSLRRLKTDYIDLYQIHWPDYNTPILETMETLNEIKKSGKIRYIGLSNFPVKLAKEAMQYGEVVSEQCLYNMIDRNSDEYHGIPLYYHTEEEILPFCREKNLGFIPYSPLLQGLLTGKFTHVKDFNNTDVRNANPQFRGEAFERNLEIVEKLKTIAKRLDKPMSQLALNWLISNRTVTTIICGATRKSQAIENAKAAEWSLDSDTLKEINSIL